MVKLYENPLSPYAQKCKIALREKGIGFDLEAPELLSLSGVEADADFASANPRLEVPALIDGTQSVFDSTIILEYIEDRWPEPPLLPATAADRARVRMIEDVCDTQYDAINWGMMELVVFKRAEGELASEMLARATEQAVGMQSWLDRELGAREWFNGDRFGWGDLSVIPYVNASAYFGVEPERGSALAHWLVRANERPSVVQTAAEAADEVAKRVGAVGALLGTPGFKREYRDHRLEWMIRSGGISIVEQGIREGTIRFSREMG